MEGVGSAADIDAVAKLGFNHPMGPLELSDLIGNDTVLYIMEVLHAGFGDSKYRPWSIAAEICRGPGGWDASPVKVSTTIQNNGKDGAVAL